MESYQPSLKAMTLRSELKLYLEKPERTKAGFVKDVLPLYGWLSKRDKQYITLGE